MHFVTGTTCFVKGQTPISKYSNSLFKIWQRPNEADNNIHICKNLVDGTEF